MALTRLVPGNQLRTLPGGTWNQFCDATDFVQQMQRQGAGIPQAPNISPAWRQTVDVVPTTDLKIGDVVSLEIDPSRHVDDQNLGRAMQPLSFEAQLLIADTFTPSEIEYRTWGIANQPVKANQHAPGAVTVGGLAWSRIRVVNTIAENVSPWNGRADEADTTPQLICQPGAGPSTVFGYSVSWFEVNWQAQEPQDGWALINIIQTLEPKPAAAVLYNELNPVNYKVVAVSEEPYLDPSYGDGAVAVLFPTLGSDPFGPGFWDQPLHRNEGGASVPSTAAPVNLTPTRIFASVDRPRLVHGLYWRDIFYVTSVPPTAIVHGLAQAAVTSGDITLTTVETQVGQDPWWHRITEEGFDREAQTLVVSNPFGFAVAEGGLVRAVENDYGVWQAVQAECP